MLPPIGCCTTIGRFGAGARIGLLHLSMYVDDRQVVTYLSRRMEEEGLRTVLLDPRQLRPSLRARVEGRDVNLDGLFRFFPADWLERLERRTGWWELFESSTVCNPLTTVLTQGRLLRRNLDGGFGRPISHG